MSAAVALYAFVVGLLVGFIGGVVLTLLGVSPESMEPRR